jgi:uncharacterized protein YacL (UPF0231 family)
VRQLQCNLMTRISVQHCIVDRMRQHEIREHRDIIYNTVQPAYTVYIKVLETVHYIITEV